MKKTYILTVIGARRVTLSVEGEEVPFWSLDFAGTLTSVGAAKEAIRFLQKRGEALTKRGLELTGFRATELVWTYRIVTEPAVLNIGGDTHFRNDRGLRA